MFRMMIAGLLVYLLIPEDVSVIASPSASTEPVTAGRTLDAANSILKDITGFCTRNEQTCETGKALLINAKSVFQTGLDKAGLENKTGSNDGTSDLSPSSNPSIEQRKLEIPTQ